jgi:hypothetical protein
VWVGFSLVMVLSAQRPGVQRRSPAELVNSNRKLGALTTCRCSELNVAGFVRCNAVVGRRGYEPIDTYENSGAGVSRRLCLTRIFRLCDLPARPRPFARSNARYGAIDGFAAAVGRCKPLLEIVAVKAA